MTRTNIDLDVTWFYNSFEFSKKMDLWSSFQITPDQQNYFSLDVQPISSSKDTFRYSIIGSIIYCSSEYQYYTFLSITLHVTIKQ